MENKEVIQKFYESFAQGDSQKMIECYHSDIHFFDPAFGHLLGNDANDMWKLLLERSKGKIKITYSNIQANDQTGSANWEAEYPYGKNQRRVLNKISASFEFKDGKIWKHTDQFDLWSWSRQALGVPGLLFGWTSWMQKKIRKQTHHLLKNYQRQ